MAGRKIGRYDDLAAKVHAAIEAGQKAAAASPDDGGSANLDHLVLTDLPRVRESSLRAAGIDCWKHGSGFHLSAPFDGQGNRRYLGVQAMYQALKAADVPCYIHYQLD